MTKFTDTAVSTNLATDKIPTETALGVKGYSTPATLKTYGQIGTTTNDNAAAGSVGEVLSSTVASGAAVSLSTSTAANITSVSLTAGDWDVWGQVGFLPAATTSITDLQGGINTTTETLPSGELVESSRFARRFAATVPGANVQIYSLSPARISIASTTTVYLVARGIFTVDTLGGFGKIVARRVR